MSAQPPAVPAAEISAVLAWAARLAVAGPAARTAATAPYLTANASVLERIPAGLHTGGGAPGHIAAARYPATRSPQPPAPPALDAAPVRVVGAGETGPGVVLGRLHRTCNEGVAAVGTAESGGGAGADATL